MLWLTLLSLAFGGDCELDVPSDTPLLEALGPQAQPLLVVELWVDGATPEWIDSVSAALESRDLRAAVVTEALLPAARVERWSQILAKHKLDTPATKVSHEEALPTVLPLVERGHEAVLVFDAAWLPRINGGPDKDFSKAFLKDIKKRNKAAYGSAPHVAASPLGTRIAEALLLRGGFRTQIELPGLTTGKARATAFFVGTNQNGMVLPAGPYLGDCGGDPRVTGFSPAAADRATRALREADRLAGPTVVRVALLGEGGSDTDAEVLGRWLDRIIAPTAIKVLPPSEVRQVLVRRANAQLIEEETGPKAAARGGRMVRVTDVRAAAEALRSVDRLPRNNPGDMNLTETWLAFAGLLTEKDREGVVQLPALNGPIETAETSLPGYRFEVPRSTVLALAHATMLALPQRIPASLPVHGKLLTASEVLTLFASAIRGEDPSVARTTSNPDPRDPGLGWGSSTTP